jgi:Tol biopolymer transport system component
LKNGGVEIFTIDPRTGDPPPHGAPPPGPGPYAFSPDGTRFAFFVSTGGGTAKRLYTCAADGSDVVLAAEYPASEVTSMSPSPDGRWIVASDRLDDTSARQRIAVFATDGSGMRILDLGELSATDPSWAPTSDLIVFAGESPDGSRSLYTIEVDGSAGPVPLVDVGVDATPFGLDPEPSWSPDGQWIAYVRITSGDQVPPTTAVHLVRPDGSEDHVLAAPDGWSSTPTWAPDGRSLLVRNEIGTVRLVVVPADGTPARQVGPPSTVGALRRFAWSPDGRMIVADIETSEGSYGAALIDVASNTWRVVGGELGIVGPFSWQAIPAGPRAEP